MGSRNRDPARFDKLEDDAIEAVQELRSTITPDMTEENERILILERIKNISRSQIALACEYLLSENLSTMPEQNTPVVEHVVAMARATQYDAIINMLGRYVLDDDLELFESNMHFSIRRLELERDKRKTAKKKNDGRKKEGKKKK